jgi:hypothetical protein
LLLLRASSTSALGVAFVSTAAARALVVAPLRSR